MKDNNIQSVQLGEKTMVCADKSIQDEESSLELDLWTLSKLDIATVHCGETAPFVPERGRS